MDTHPDRPQPGRSVTDFNQALYLQNRAAGDYTPESSPLDQFILRQRLLSKQLKSERNGSLGQVGSRPVVVHRGPDPQPLQSPRNMARPSQTQPQWAEGHSQGEVAGDRQLAAPEDDGRPISSYCRFSTVTESSAGDRDSLISDRDRDSSILGVFSLGVPNRNPPGRIQAGRVPSQESVRPILDRISNIDEELSPRAIPPPKTAMLPPASMGMPLPNTIREEPERSGRERSRGDYDQSREAAYARSRSQPPPRQRRPPARQGSGDDKRSPIESQGMWRPEITNAPPRRDGPPRREPPRTYDAPRGYGPPSRNGSAESGRFPPPDRQDSGNSDKLLPYRQGSIESKRRYNPPSRQNSGESEPKYIPYRKDSGDAPGRDIPPRSDSLDLDRGLVQVPSRSTPSPKPSGPNIFPMLSTIRAVSPESMHRSNSVSDVDRAPSPQMSQTPPVERSPIERSPSALSDHASVYSVGGTKMPPKPIFNFSRPLSNRPSISSMDSRKPSIDTSHLGHEQHHMDNLPITPVSMTDEAAEHSESGVPAPTYIHSRFTLPRGRFVERGSVVFLDTPSLEHQRKRSQASLGPPVTPTGVRPPSPMSPPKGAVEHSRSPSGQVKRPAHLTPLSSAHSSSTSTHSVSTPRLHTTHAANMSAEEHLQIGLDLHEKGSLQESTYHFRCAAHGGHPTGMLFYALACRHGWGMRPNQKDGVMWLKKVTQLASSEVADDENGITNVAFIEKQGRRAQFALSIYELGVSHLNGWGTEMDKGLALNCFEIAGKWGDADALSEAGFCYANGIGTKKDLKKAAKFYRLAEAKGVNMVGNSWIWKDKYLDDEARAEKAKKNGESPSPPHKKEGGFFSRKKSVV